MHILHCLIWIVRSCSSELKPLKFSFLTFRRSANTYLSQNGWEDQEAWCLMYLVHCLGPSGFPVDAILLALPSHHPFKCGTQRQLCLSPAQRHPWLQNDKNLVFPMQPVLWRSGCLCGRHSSQVSYLTAFPQGPSQPFTCVCPIALTEFSQTHMPGETCETASPLPLRCENCAFHFSTACSVIPGI